VMTMTKVDVGRAQNDMIAVVLQIVEQFPATMSLTYQYEDEILTAEGKDVTIVPNEFWTPERRALVDRYRATAARRA